MITAVLPWWNERPEDLDTCVRAAGTIADRVVALDGAYRRYPDATVTSPPEQAEAIKAAAMAVGMGCEVIEPTELWAGQVAKRTALLQHVLDTTDWIATIDADHILHVSDPARVKAELARLTDDVVEVPYHTPRNPDRSMAKSAAGEWHANQADIVVNIPHLWRALPGMRVERRHWWYSAHKGGRRVWLWSSDESYPHVPHHLLKAPYWVEHRCLFRTNKQVLASRAFLNDREKVIAMTSQEDDVPGLPPPYYNYHRMPA